MPRLEAGQGEVGNLVVEEPGLGQHRAGALEHGDLALLVLAPFAGGKLLEERRVLLVGEGVSGDMPRRAGQRGAQRFLPLRLALAGQREHQVDVDVVEAVRAQELDSGGDVLRRVLAAEGLEQRRVERLRAEADAVDAGLAPRGGFLRGDRGRVDLERELEQVAVERGVAQRPDQLAEKFRRQHRGRAAAEVDRLQRERKFLARAPPFLAQRGDESRAGRPRRPDARRTRNKGRSSRKTAYARRGGGP